MSCKTCKKVRRFATAPLRGAKKQIKRLGSKKPQAIV